MSDDITGSEGDNMIEDSTPTAEENEPTETAVENQAPIVEDAQTSDEIVTAVSQDELAVANESDAEDEPVVEDTSQPDSAPTEVVEVQTSKSRFQRGDLIEGIIAKTSPTEVIIDLGEGDTGIIPGRELENMGRQALEELKEGENLTVFVVNPNNHHGKTILSINRAIEELNWQEAETYKKDRSIYEGNVSGYNKGGLIVRFGRVRGFVPQSQISDERRRKMQGVTPEELYGDFVGKNIHVKVIEVDRSRNRLILSERAATRESRESRKEQLIKELTVGQVIVGRVVSLEDFGAFVDVGGAEGLVHLTEITWRHITHAEEVLKVGQEAKVEVISVDRERKRIGLSMKRQEADPWDEVATTYDYGQLVRATVTKLTKFGAFARLVDAPDIEGLIHISELSEKRVTHPREVVEENEELTLRVVKIDVRNRRLGLSLKRVDSAEFLDQDMEFFSEQIEQATDDESPSTESVEEVIAPDNETSEPDESVTEDIISDNDESVADDQE